jgi:site-specific DNA recombinase
MRSPAAIRPVHAGIYCRISLASYGDTTKTADQERICRDLAARLGWDVIDVYSDDSKSAWQANRKRREWNRMLADVGSGRINGIITYHGDRLIRRHEDLSELLKLAKSKGIRLASPTGTRNLDSYDDQFILEIECSMAKRESANISRRQKARYDRDRLNGKVMAQGPGGRRFGYCSDGVTLYPADRCDVATRQEVAEAHIIGEMAARTLAGESANAIEADLTGRGWTTPAGNRLEHGALKRLLRNPRYAGLMPDGETAAAWPAILDRETWERARIMIDARASRYAREPLPAKHLLSGIATCVCGKPMRIAHVTSRGYRTLVYACAKRDTGGCGKVYRNAVHLDAYVSAAVVGRIAHEANPQSELPAPDYAPEWAALTAERAATEQLLGDWQVSARRAPILMKRLDAIDARIAQLRELADTSSRDRLLEQYEGISLREFKALPLDVRRALVAATVTVTVLPASKRGPGFRAEDVRVVPVQ